MTNATVESVWDYPRPPRIDPSEELVVDDVEVARAAWTYELPSPGFELLAGAVAVMPALVDRCTVDGEVVEPQQGGFYGGWITSRVVGPFKGGPGTTGW